METKIESALSKFRKLEQETDAPVAETVGGWDSILGKNVFIICAGYFYEGKLTGISSGFVELEEASIVYNPESFTRENISKCTRDKLPCAKWYVERSAVESYGAL